MATILGVITTPLVADTYTLEQALLLARKHSLKTLEWQALTNKIKAKSEGFEGAFDTTIYANAQNSADRSKSLQPTSGDSRDLTTVQIGAKKLFGSGTSIDMNIESQRQNINYPEIATDPNNPAAAAQAQASASSLQVNPNPNFQNKISLTISQSLWKNFGAREVDLQKKIALSQSIAPYYTGKIFEQIIQAETEQLFWTLQKLNDQITVAQNLVKKSNRFSTLMKRRISMGRADEVDMASAESQSVFHEGNLLNLEIAAEEIREKIAYRISPNDPDFSLKIKANLTSPPLALPAKTRAAAKKQGIETRLDIQQISKQIPAVQAEKDLAVEQGKPEINLWGNLSANGIAEKNSEANKDLKDFKQRAVTIGVSFSMPIGNTASTTGVQAAGFASQKLGFQKEIIARDFRQEIDRAFTNLESANKRRLQSEKNIYSLERQLKEERKKFDQARSEEIASIRFEMEVLAAKSNVIEAHYMARISESQIRLALHNYPTEVK